MDTRVLEKANLEYWELRSENTSSTAIRTWNSDVKELSQSQREGYSLRILTKQGWGFAHSSDNDVKGLLSKAQAIAKIMHSPQKIFHSKAIKARKETTNKINANDISIDEKKTLLLDAAKLTKKPVTAVQLSYQDSTKEKTFLNSDGSDIQQTLRYSYTGAQITAKAKRMESFYLSEGATAGYEFASSHVQSNTQKAIDESILQLKAIVPKGGSFPIIADPGLTDVFVHEAVGHSAEADHVLQKQTCLEGQSTIAPDHITIIDDGTVPGAWGSYFFDEEGSQAKKTEIIKNGTIHQFLHSRITAQELSSIPTGNARAQDVSLQPIVRMSNTYIKKGEYSKEELLEDMKNGFYLIGSRGGQVDPAKGNFQFSCQTGYVVKNGELKDRVRGVSIGGHTLKTLQSISKISKQYEPGMPGFCGKGGQSVPVIGNCPHIYIDKVDVGGKQ